MEKNSRKNVLVIGAGPAGMMAAITAAQKGAQVTLLERNPRVGRKLGITGKGRCNVTNAAPMSEFQTNVISNPRFLYSSIAHFTNQDTMQFFEAAGVPLKVERGNRVFPVSDQARDIIDAMVSELKKKHVRLITGFRVDRLVHENGNWCVYKKESTEAPDFIADHVIICTGGNSYRATGSTGDGYKLAEALGHTIVDLRPGLNAITSPDEGLLELQGLSLRNVASWITVNEKKIPGTEGFGEMLFTHFGVSGPLILTAESYLQSYLLKKKQKWADQQVILHIDLKNALSEEELQARVVKDLTQYAPKNMHNAMIDLLPVKMILPVLKKAGIDPDQKAGSLSRKDRAELVKTLKDFQVNLSAARPMEEAIVTMGGVNVKEIDPKTLESKKVPGLYFAGEVMDVDAVTGGFNLQIAFSTGALAGTCAADFERRDEHVCHCD